MSVVHPSTSTGARTGTAVSGLLAAVVAAIVLGILGMHALSTPGGMSNADHGGHASPSGNIGGANTYLGANPIDATVDSGTAGPVGSDDSAGFGTGSGAGGGHDMHNMGGMVMLCAAMLATSAALVLYLVLGRRGTPRFWAFVASSVTVTTTWVTSRLGARPPPVWEFSVIRC